MDGLSGAASVIAVVSFAIQLAESTKKLYDFWKSVDDAPDSVREIVADLKLLSTTLTEIAIHEQKYGNNGSITDILESSTEQVQTMLRMITKLEHGLQSKSIRKRKWSAIKAVFGEEKIAKFQQRLLNTKTTLLLARQTLSDRSIQAYFDRNGQVLAAFSQNMDTLREQNKQTSEILTTLEATSKASPDEAIKKLLDHAASHIANPIMRSGFKKALGTTIRQAQEGPTKGQVLGHDARARDVLSAPPLEMANRQWHLLAPNSSRTTKTLFGNVTVQTNTREKIEKDKRCRHIRHVTKHKTRIIFRPAAWLVRFGLAYEFQLELFGSLHSLKTTFQVFQPVPDDSLIFEFCRSGNIHAVQTLLSRKQASVRDTNSKGWTPLHFALHAFELELVRCLLSEGADCDAVTYRQQSCLEVLFLGHESPWMESNRGTPQVTFYIFSQLAHQFDWLQRGFYFNCDFVDCACGLGDGPESGSESGSGTDSGIGSGTDSGTDSESSSESSSEYGFGPDSESRPESVCEEERTQFVKTFAQSLGASLYTSEAAGYFFWRLLCEASMPLSAIEWATSSYKCCLDARDTADGFSPILLCVAYENWAAAKAFAKHGADLHHVGKSVDHSPVAETVTSLSLYNSRGFFEWRNILRDLEIDIAGFIEDELQRSSRLREDGWDAETLSILFELEFFAVDHYDDIGNYMCTRQRDTDDDDYDQHFDNGGICGMLSGIMVEVGWQDLLEKIKHGESLAGFIDKYSKCLDSELDSQEGSNFDREIVEISEDEGLDKEEITEDHNVSDVLEINDDNPERSNEGGEVEEVCDDQKDDDDDGRSRVDESSQDCSDWDEEGQEEFVCISCWYRIFSVFPTSPSVAPASEADSNEEDSPMLLNIDI
ncbi:hypothetical protein EG329_011699 [Mollisiaceae sp. DMI_Dod_QoI]|nr:hypothetical protein EG329_011699 [Helotiales sp. DMI_Dod_QoI]